MKKSRYATAVLLALVWIAPLLLAACGSTVSATVDDATVTTRVKTALINDPGVGALRIDVDTFKGVVTLKGRVKTKEEEAKAIELARAIKGVTTVKSELLIQP
jgi:osmotically-inducible protein OsmY